MVHKTQMCLFLFLPIHTRQPSTKAGNHSKVCRLPIAAHQHSLEALHKPLFWGTRAYIGRWKQVHTILAKANESLKSDSES